MLFITVLVRQAARKTQQGRLKHLLVTGPSMRIVQSTAIFGWKQKKWARVQSENSTRHGPTGTLAKHLTIAVMVREVARKAPEHRSFGTERRSKNTWITALLGRKEDRTNRSFGMGSCSPGRSQHTRKTNLEKNKKCKKMQKHDPNNATKIPQKIQKNTK